MTTVGRFLTAIGHEHRLEGELLLAQQLNTSRAGIIANPDKEIPVECQPELAQLANRLKAGEPFAYIFGEQEFWGLSFKVSSQVLIPRPETELLVELTVGFCGEGAAVHDLGTGSGAIAVAISHERPDLRVSASDASDAALKIARANARRHHTAVTFTHSDWFRSLNGTFECIVSNPPYIAEADPHLPDLKYEPTSALVSGADGLDALTHIIGNAANYLTKGGALVLEHGFDQGEKIMALLGEHGYDNVAAHVDLAGHHRATTAIAPS